MTREVAKKIAKGIADKIECNTADIDDWAEFWCFTREDYEEFLDMPIKALEQGPKMEGARGDIPIQPTVPKMPKKKIVCRFEEQEPKPGWIPVSERLPEEDGYYITTTLYREVYCDYWNGEAFERTEIVLAWMPLPEPYKEGMI